MMRLPTFAFVEPTSLDEVVDLLATEPDAMVVSGGTDLFPNMKRRLVEPATVIGLGSVPGMSGIGVEEDGATRIGAGTLLADLASSPDAPPALAEAAGLVASPQIRNVGTVGGNLCVDTRCNWVNESPEWRAASGSCLKDGGDTCWVAPRGGVCVAVSSTDLAPAAIALAGSVRLVGPRGQREIPVSDLYRTDGMDHLTRGRDEVLVDLRIPPADGVRATYRKLRRRGAIDFPILGVGAAVRTDDDGLVTEARIVFGAVAPAPFRATEAEEALVGRGLTADVIEEVAALATKPVRPLDNTDLGSRYRKWMASVFVTRALLDLA